MCKKVLKTVKFCPDGVYLNAALNSFCLKHDNLWIPVISLLLCLHRKLKRIGLFGLDLSSHLFIKLCL